MTLHYVYIYMTKLNALLLEFSFFFYFVHASKTFFNYSLKRFFFYKQDFLIKDDVSLMGTGVCFTGYTNVPIKHSQTFCI